MPPRKGVSRAHEQKSHLRSLRKLLALDDEEAAVPMEYEQEEEGHAAKDVPGSVEEPETKRAKKTDLGKAQENHDEDGEDDDNDKDEKKEKPKKKKKTKEDRKSPSKDAIDKKKHKKRHKE